MNYTRAKACFQVFLLLVTVFGGESDIFTGMGESRSDGERGARKNALWTFASTLIAPGVRAENEEQIRQILFGALDTCIAAEDVLSSHREYGLYSVESRIDIREDVVIDLLSSRGFLSSKEVQKPSILLLLDEYTEGERVKGNVVTHVIEGELTNRGYSLVDYDQLEELQGQRNEREDIASLGFSRGADIIIRGRVDVSAPRVQKAYGVSQISVPVTVNARVIRADNAEIITSLSERVIQRTMDEFSARDDGLRKGGALISEGIDAALEEYWRESVFGLRSLELIVSFPDSEKLRNIESNFQELSGIKDIQLRYMENNTGVYDVRVLGTVQALRESIEESGDWRITALSPGKIALQGAEDAPEKEVGYTIETPHLSIGAAEIEPIFPSRLHYYENNDIAMVQCSIDQGSVDDLRVQVNIPDLMELPSEKVVSLRAGEEKSISMNLLLSAEKLLDFSSQRRVPADISLRYYRDGQEQVRSLTVPVQVFTRNGLDWNNLPSLGSFVTYQNPTVARVSRWVISSSERSDVLPDDVSDAVAVFSALREHGFTYTSDPVTIAASGLDQVSFPLETLENRTGDCDDFAVLYAAMLSALGIPAAFIVYEDHVLTMFNTGVFEKNADVFGVDREKVIIHNNQCWIPVETTMLRDSFLDAWHAAANRFRQSAADGASIEIMEVARAWDKYPPFDYGRTSDISFQTVASAIRSDIKLIEDYTQNSIHRVITTLENKSDRSVREDNRLGRLYARAGNIDKARESFSELVGQHGSNAALRNNYACVLFLMGNEDDAFREINEALATERSTEILSNKALFYYVSSRDDAQEEFRRMVQDIYTESGDPAVFDRLLGIPVSAEPTQRASEQSGTDQSIDKSRLQDMIRQQVRADDIDTEETEDTYGGNVMPFGGVRGADPTQIGQIRDLLVWMEL
ncbi:MAG: transglutaminase domain-containing protein [Fibrobacterota bacterium]